MGHGPTLILTTRLGVRPLGVRGDPLACGRRPAAHRHPPPPGRRAGQPAGRAAAARIGRRHRLVREPDRRRPPLRRALSEPERQQALATVDGHLAAINGLGDQLAASQTSDEARLIGRSLQLSTRRPSDDYIFLVDGQPVIAAWGYEPDALASLAGLHADRRCRRSRRRRAPAAAPAAVLASAPAIVPAAFRWSRWWGALLWGLLFLILLLLASWLLRACAPVDPSLNVATQETPAPPAPAPPPDPTPVLKASLDDAQTDEKKLKAELAALQDDIKHKVAMCKPIEAAQAAASAGGRQGTATASAASPAAAAGARRAAAQPAAARHAAVRLVGRFGRRRRHPKQTLSGRQAWIRGDQLQPVCPAR